MILGPVQIVNSAVVKLGTTAEILVVLDTSPNDNDSVQDITVYKDNVVSTGWLKSLKSQYANQVKLNIISR